ncbi:hypothetical protein DP939_24480 [Spongiactinospora rosea]|uniref:Uncharacterized protein n=1 Tax=Spongiactinospora rosea TaxID=2248750 RepID=A0A366LVY8_9ACTN|nr:hypothetical protein [Spongiactinospora rosea]RBQ17529.1 hypothetical protein DP939_24480 [Spongiactinospora rosea]
MTIDITAANRFMIAHARLLDRRRFGLITGDCGPDAAVAALAAYGDTDGDTDGDTGGGYGWALEPDLRAPESQPVCALHAFEVFADIAPATSPRAAALCDWLASVTLPDGGLPFALPIAGDTTGTAPFWLDADPRRSSLHMTAMLAGIAHRVGAHDPAVARHPWLARATGHAMDAIAALEGPGHAIEFRFVLQLLDVLYGAHPEAPAQLRRLAAFLPESGRMPVAGGAPGESLGPLDFAPLPGTPLRALLPADHVAAELERLAAGQLPDGGWTVDWESRTPAGALEWRGWATVRALTILRANSLL